LYLVLGRPPAYLSGGLSSAKRASRAQNQIYLGFAEAPREPKPPPAEARYCGCVPQAPTRRICNTANLRGAIHGK